MSELTAKQVKDFRDFLDKRVVDKEVSCQSCALLKQFPEVSHEEASSVINKWEQDKKS